MNRKLLYGIFAISGGTSLIFETLWFRLAGLTFGNSVWASSLVLASFMLGIAIGNGLAARYVARLRRPVAAYAVLEIVIAVSGLALVYGLPEMTDALASILRPMLDRPWILNPARLVLCFMIMLVPATAMGATLPVLVKGMHTTGKSFGAVLGSLYGVNTLGAMLGPIAAEAILIEKLGIRGTGILAAGLGVGAGLAALMLIRGRIESVAVSNCESERPTPRSEFSMKVRGYLLATFLSGAILLALEVVWFRFLHLFVHAGELAFASMLATVLLGIGVGGYVAGFWIRRDPNAYRHASSLAFLAGCASICVYANFELAIAPYGLDYIHDIVDIFWLTLFTTFPVCVLSGALFPLLGAAVAQEVVPGPRAAGLLTLSNTLGAGLGSILAGFVLLPYLGMEWCFLLLSACYGLVGIVLMASERQALAAKMTLIPAFGFAVALALFPRGLMEQNYLQTPVLRYHGEPSEIEQIDEGTQQTIIYLRDEIDGQLVSRRLITNAYSMSSTSEPSRRYMRIFAYWPIAMKPNTNRALLISYGVGETAKALIDTKSLSLIDVVDTSREILESSSLFYPDPKDDPLEDPRVTTHIEDGRYFLATTKNRYDLITGEPPPPKIAGVVNLYTREYFQLIHDRLTRGGISTYWLPAHNLTDSDVKAVIRAYCEVFRDCALWSGSHLDWMLTGSNGGIARPTVEGFSRQWRDPATAENLRRIGLDRPELLGTLFMAGPRRLRALTANTPPLVDDFPKRLEDDLPTPNIAAIHRPLMDVDLAQRDFYESPFIRRTWPPAIQERAYEQFEYQRMLLKTYDGGNLPDVIFDLHRVLSETPYRFLAVRVMGESGDTLAVVRRLLENGAGADRYRIQLAIEAFADRDFERAAKHLERARINDPRNDRLFFAHVYALCMSGDLVAAHELAAKEASRFIRTARGHEVRRFLQETFDLEV